MFLEERQFEHNLIDLKMKSEIVKTLSDDGFKNFTQINVDVFEGVVLLTGHVDKLEQRQKAVKTSYQQEGVARVINEIKIGDTINFQDFSHDEWINLQLQTALTFDSNISAVNYTSRTTGGNIYLMGIAQTTEEEELVILHAREIPNVHSVTSFVRKKNDPERLDWLKKVNDK